MGFLLDSNIVSERIKAEPNRRVISKILFYTGSMAISAATFFELRKGYLLMPDGRKKDKIADYIEREVIRDFPILDFDFEAANWLADQHARLEKRGLRRPELDGLIAATAVTRDLTLVTRNIDDFDGYEGLRIENWFEG